MFPTIKQHLKIVSYLNRFQNDTICVDKAHFRLFLPTFMNIDIEQRNLQEPKIRGTPPTHHILRL